MSIDKDKLNQQIAKLQGKIKKHYMCSLIVMSFTLSIIAFNDEWIRLINTLIVCPIMSKLDNVIYPTFAFIMIAIYYVFIVGYERKQNYKRTQIIAFLVIAYSICKFSDVWYFYSFQIAIINIAYSDVIYLFALGEIWVWLWLKIKQRKITKQDDFFEYDCPAINYDSYKQSDVINVIAEKLQISFFTKGSFAVGITGTWGRGKSTVLMAIKDKIFLENKVNNKDVLCVEFNPWHSDDPKTIVRDFILKYKSGIEKYIPELSNTLFEYSELLTNSIYDKTIFSDIINRATHYVFNNDNNASSQFTKISEALKKSNLKSIVFIDDLDRLDFQEIMGVLRIIRNTANFPNTLFIVAYDKDYVVQTMSENKIPRAEEYLEKVFNLEIPLPKFEEGIICKELLRRISNYIESDISEINMSMHRSMVYRSFEDNETQENSYYIVPKILRTHRDVIRFFNSFKLIWETVKKRNVENDILLSDLFYLELIRYRFKAIYDVLRDQPDFFLSRNMDDYPFYEYKEYDRDSYEKESVSKPEHENLTKLESIITITNSSDIYILKTIIKYLFPSYKKGINSISSVRSIGKYFSFNLDEKNLTAAEFAQIKYREPCDYAAVHELLYEWILNKNEEELREHLMLLLWERESEEHILLTYELFKNMINKESHNTQQLGVSILYDYMKQFPYITDNQFKSLLELLDYMFNVNNHFFNLADRTSIMMSFIFDENLKTKVYDDKERKQVIEIIRTFLSEVKSKQVFRQIFDSIVESTKNSNITKDSFVIPQKTIYELLNSDTENN